MDLRIPLITNGDDGNSVLIFIRQIPFEISWKILTEATIVSRTIVLLIGVGLVCGVQAQTLQDSDATQPESLSNLVINGNSTDSRNAFLTNDGLAANQKPFLPGMQWRVPEEVAQQKREKQQLLKELQSSRDFWLPGWSQMLGKSIGGTAKSRSELEMRLSKITPTGRVLLPEQDPYLLEARPNLNPRLSSGQRVIVTAQPVTVSVIDGNGAVCTVPFRPGVLARHYVLVCATGSRADLDWAWLIQPDGSVSKVGLESWNTSVQPAPAPGSWIWAPSRALNYSEEFSQRLARFITTLGPSGVTQDNVHFSASRRPMDNPISVMRSIKEAGLVQNLPVTPNDWGVIGLLQTPSARMAEEGTVSFTYSNANPYQRYSFSLQPFSWLEFGFRYTRIDNRQFGGPASDPINFAYQDKSLPVKVKLLNESYYLPQIAVGAYDITGTGLFGGQYLVGSKRFDRFDFSAGLGWGYNGARQNLPNPFGQNGSGQGGNSQGDLTGGYFTGRTALFGGVQYHAPLAPVLLKAEVDGNNYMREPLNNQLYSRAPFPVNVGATYLWPNVQMSVGYERGNTLMLSLTFTDNLGKLNRSSNIQTKSIPVERKPVGLVGTAVTNEPPAQLPKNQPKNATEVRASNINSDAPASKPINSQLTVSMPLQSEALTPAAYQVTLEGIATASGWEATELRQVGSEWWIDFDKTPAIYIEDTIQSVIAIMHRDAPNQVSTFRLRISNYSLEVVEYAVDRKQWMLGQTQLLPPHLAKIKPLKIEPFSLVSKSNKLTDQRLELTSNSADGALKESPSSVGVLPPTTSALLAYSSPKRYDWGVGVGYQQIIAGPNNFGPIFAVNLNASGTAKLWRGAWAAGTVSLQGPNNLGHYNYTYSGAANPGNVPRVRTYLNEYWNSSLITVPNLQLTQVKQAGNNHFFSAYGGMLEWMFGGVGGEYLYRPVSSPVVLGVNINRVKQRGFDQNLQFLSPSYLVNTGHATAYWDTGWQNILVKGSVGQYLAGDRGATLDVSKVFNNGVQIGVYGTKTNMPANYYGEGGFDKGVYLSIPFDSFLNKKTNAVATFMYQPYYKDGGAFLQRKYPLYDLTRMRDQRALSVGAGDQSESLMPVQPF